MASLKGFRPLQQAASPHLDLLCSQYQGHIYSKSRCIGCITDHVLYSKEKSDILASRILPRRGVWSRLVTISYRRRCVWRGSHCQIWEARSYLGGCTIKQSPCPGITRHQFCSLNLRGTGRLCCIVHQISLPTFRSANYSSLSIYYRNEVQTFMVALMGWRLVVRS